MEINVKTTFQKGRKKTGENTFTPEGVFKVTYVKYCHFLCSYEGISHSIELLHIMHSRITPEALICRMHSYPAAARVV